jgi:hypothetical protein
MGVYARPPASRPLLLVQKARASAISRWLADDAWAAVAIKRSGVHKVLIQGEDIAASANFTRGISRGIDRLRRERGS